MNTTYQTLIVERAGPVAVVKLNRPDKRNSIGGPMMVELHAVLGLLLASKSALPLFPESGGSIVNISSVVSALAPPTAAVYASSKAAVDAITKSLAKELGARGIRVNAINPGVIRTEGLTSAGIADSPLEAQLASMSALGRVGLPDDVALPAVFLASDDARYITGETLFVSGGAGM